MNDAARLLRYAAPGALFLLLYGVWFLFDSHRSGRDLPDIGLGTAALIAGAAIPIGFVAGMVAGEITWFGPLRRWLFRTIDNEAIAYQRLRDVDELDLKRLAGIVDVRLHEAYGEDEHPHALRRARSIADLYQGLAHGAVAALLALLSIWVTLVVTSVWPGEDSLDEHRWVAVAVSTIVCLVLLAGMCISHRRVVRIAEAMVDDILRARR